MKGGKRKGAGRKPGIKTKPIRLSEKLLNQLEQLGDPKELIVKACEDVYNLDL